jgi:ketosteroid isomerase-like protein
VVEGDGADLSPELARLFEIYDAFVEGRLECIPEYFDPQGCYRPSGVFPGMKDRYVGHEEIVEFWHAATEPWESLEIEVGNTDVRGEDVVAQIWLSGRGRESGIEVKGVEAGHLVRFRNLKIVEYLAFPTWDLALEHLNQLTAGRAGRAGRDPRPGAARST